MEYQEARKKVLAKKATDSAGAAIPAGIFPKVAGSDLRLIMYKT
jgi:hypothetical protein